MVAATTGGSWTRRRRGTPRRRAAVGGLLLAALALGGCTGGSPRAAASPSPPPPDLTYNARAGSNRAAAEASTAVARSLFADGGGYWEVFVKTEPLDPSPPRNPLDPAQIAAQAAAVTSIEVVMATESGLAIQRFRKGGHDHEESSTTAAARLLQADFPKATTIQIRIFFGESHQHALATWAAGSLDYKVLDAL